jgi:hypothetical protein
VDGSDAFLIEESILSTAPTYSLFQYLSEIVTETVGAVDMSKTGVEPTGYARSGVQSFPPSMMKVCRG